MKKEILVVSLFIISVFSCGKEKTQTAGSESFLHVTTAPVTRMTMVDTIGIYGRVQLRSQAYLASQFDGRLADFSLLMGDKVVKHQRIATIVPPAREALLQTLKNVDVNTRAVLEKQINSIPLTSPITGVVLDVRHYTGDVVQKGEAIAFIGDVSVLDVYGDLPIRYLPLIQTMTQVPVTFVDYPHAPVSLPLMAISGKVDETKQTLPIRLELDNAGGEYRPGMLVRLLLSNRVHESVLVIPRSALLEEEGIYSAFVIQNRKAEKRTLRIGITGSEWVEVRSGLSENEPVVTDKAYSLTDGMEVIAE